uniref:B-cell receptor CD22 n=1 Tax=Sander lucioperca TaxID=283035 RepID=A0A8D0CT80_SANLU
RAVSMNCITGAVMIQGQDDWGVTYTSTQICALKGSTVNISCSYTYPSTINHNVTKVEKKFWFTKGSNNAPVDLKTDSDYTGRVKYFFDNDDCTLRISDLKERDSDEYKFRFITNLPGGSFAGSPGVTLSVTDLQVQVTRSRTQGELRCHSSCNVPDNPSYVWFNNGQKMDGETSSLRVSVEDNDSYSCAVTGYEDYLIVNVLFPSDAPKVVTLSLTPTWDIRENSRVTLTCSSDANPAATYTWYKNGKPLYKNTQIVFRSIQSSDSGEYYCKAENKLGRRTSRSISIDVKYGPKLPSVSVSPSAEIVEGSSVTLTCSSDANPAATYTWLKSNGKLRPPIEEQQLVLTSIQSSHSGQYTCRATNSLGSNTSKPISIKVKCE